MNRRRLQNQPSAEPSVDLDAWATTLVATPDAVDGVRQRAKVMADDKRLAAADREFARAQVAAIQRAVRRSRKPRQ